MEIFAYIFDLMGKNIFPSIVIVCVCVCVLPIFLYFVLKTFSDNFLEQKRKKTNMKCRKINFYSHRKVVKLLSFIQKKLDKKPQSINLHTKSLWLAFNKNRKPHPFKRKARIYVSRHYVDDYTPQATDSISLVSHISFMLCCSTLTAHFTMEFNNVFLSIFNLCRLLCFITFF